MYLKHLTDRELLSCAQGPLREVLVEPLMAELAIRLEIRLDHEREEKNRRFGQPHYGHGHG